MSFFKFADDNLYRLLGRYLESLARRLQTLGECFHHTRGRTRFTDFIFGNIYSVGSPHLYLSVVCFDNAAYVHITRLHCRCQNGNEARGVYLQHLIAVFGLFAEGEGLLSVEFEGFQIRYLRYVEMFGYLRTDLSRVAVDCLPTGRS